MFNLNDGAKHSVENTANKLAENNSTFYIVIVSIVYLLTNISCTYVKQKQ